MKILFRNFPDIWRLDPAPPSSMTFDHTHDVTCSVTSGTDMTCEMTSASYHVTVDVDVDPGKMTSDSRDHIHHDSCYHCSNPDQSCNLHSKYGCHYQEEGHDCFTHSPSDSSQNSTHPKHAFGSSEIQNCHSSNNYQYVNSGSEWFTFRDLAKVRFYCAVSFIVIYSSLSSCYEVYHLVTL